MHANSAALLDHSTTMDQRGSEGSWPHETVTPSRRWTDASKIAFPLQTVVVIVGTTLASTGAFWALTGSLRADVAVIKAQMDARVAVDAAKADAEHAREALLEERITSLKDLVQALQRQETLNGVEMQNIREKIVQQGPRK